jgi:hypothetical protein
MPAAAWTPRPKVVVALRVAEIVSTVSMEKFGTKTKTSKKGIPQLFSQQLVS